MKNNFTFLVIFSLLLFGVNQLKSQDPLQLTLEMDQQLLSEDQVDVDLRVRVSNFTDIAAMQYVLTWDPEVLQIDSIPFVTDALPGLTAASMALPSQTYDMILGRITLSWSDPSASSQDLADNTHLYTLRFKAVGDMCDETVFALGSTNTAETEVFTSDFTFLDVELSNTNVLIAGNNCTNFVEALSCNDNVNFYITEQVSPWTLQPQDILEGGPYNYSVMQVSPAQISCDDIGSTIQVTVTNTENNNSCWGNIEISGDCNPFSNTVICNNEINLSLSPWGGDVTLTPDMILEGGPYNYDDFEVSPATVNCDDAGQVLQVTVTNTVTNNSCWSTLKVEDKSPPVAVTKENIIISLSVDSNGEYSAKLFAESADNGSYDACSDIVFEPAFWEFYCSDLGENRIVLNVIDEFGNSNSVMTDVEVIIGGSPQVECPADVVINCNESISDLEILGGAQVADNCFLSFTDTQGYDGNGDGSINGSYMLNGELVNEEYDACSQGSILREWKIEGETVCTQVIGVKSSAVVFDGSTMIDWPYSKNIFAEYANNDSGSCTNSCSPIDPMDIEFIISNGVEVGARFTVECFEALCEEPVFPTDGCQLIGYNIEDTNFNLPNGDLLVKRTFTAIDWCQYDPSVNDEQGIWTWEIEATVVGGGKIVSLIAKDETVKENGQICTPIVVAGFENVESFQGSLSWDSSVVSFNSVKNFGLQGMTSSSFGITNVDNGVLSFVWFDATGLTPTTLNNGSEVFTVCFDAQGTEGDMTAFSFVDTPTEVEVFADGAVLPFQEQNGSITITEANCPGDVKAPTPYCINNVTTVLRNGVVELWAIDFNIGSFDNCTAQDDLRFTFTDVIPSDDPAFIGNSSKKTFSSSDFDSNQQLTLRMYVWDENDNGDYCSLTINAVNTNSGDTQFVIDDQQVIAGSEVCISVEAENFIDVQAFQGTLSWDPSVLSYDRVESVSLPNSSPLTVNDAGTNNGVLPFLWFDNTATSPITISGSSLFDVCFDVVGSNGQFTTVSVVDGQSEIEVTANNVVIPVSVVPGKITVFGVDENCELDESMINWPSEKLIVDIPNLNNSNIFSLLDPNALINSGIAVEDDVLPIINLPVECQSFTAYSYEDDVFEIENDLFKVLRNFTVIDWQTGAVFVFTQIIQNYPDGELICDTLPNSAPTGDCYSGHTLDDDVEWPDDILVNDHRISPDELVTISGIDQADSEPVFYNTPDIYEASYIDIVNSLSQTKLVIDREWTATRSDFPSLSWTYTQVVEVDLTEFGNLVTVNTLSSRPIPNVSLNDQEMTNEEGLAYIEIGVVDPAKSDAVKMGLNIRDLMLIQSHILNLSTLDEYELLAADFNGDSDVTSFDVFELERVLLGIIDNPTVDWMFVDETQNIQTSLAPKGHYVGIKPGDIDDSVDLGQGASSLRTEKLIIEDKLLNAGEIYNVPLYIESDLQAIGTELNLTFDNEAVEILGVTSDLVFGTISRNIINGNRLAMITENFDLSVEDIDSNTPILTIEIRALKNGVLQNVFGVSEFDESFILDHNFDLIVIEEVINGQISTGIDDIVQLNVGVGPNPVVDNLMIIDNENVLASDFTFELFEVNGRKIAEVNNNKVLDVSNYPEGVYIYRITSDDQFASGRIIKQ